MRIKDRYNNVYSTDNVSENFVSINNCAVVQISDTDHYISRLEGRSDYWLCYIAKGKGYIKFNGKEYTLREHEMFLYHPNEPQEYHFLKKDNTLEYWVHFTGVEIDRIIASLGFSDVHYIRLHSDTFEIEQTMSRMCHEFNMKQPYYQQICTGMLIAVLGMVGRSQSEKIIPQSSRNFVEHILGQFHSQPELSYRIDQFAEEHGVTVNHLIRTFKRVTGETPAQYIINFRIKKAKELLLFSEYSVDEIATLIGYSNSAYFSRLFQKHVGISPTGFRTQGNIKNTHKPN